MAAPKPPATYPLPKTFTLVRTSSELKAALGRSTPTNIVLANGVYDSSAAFQNRAGHRLYARHLGKAVLKAGLDISGGARGGAVVRGIVFDITAQYKVDHRSIISISGTTGQNAKILDCVLRGNRLIAFGVRAYNPTGLVARRLTFSNFTRVALRASDNVHVRYKAQTPHITGISDIVVDGVSRATPGDSGGRAEAGLWIGHPVDNGVQRIKVRNTAWSGIELVNNAWDTTYSDLDIDMSGPNEYAGVAVYLEHFTYHDTFQRFRIVGARIGFKGEWADPNWGGVAAAHFTTVRSGLIDAAGSTVEGNQAGLYLDEGTESTTVTGVIFRNQNWAAIGAYRNTGTNTFEGNDYSGIAPGAVPLSNDHIRAG